MILHTPLAVLISEHDLNILMLYCVMPGLAILGILLSTIGLGIIKPKAPIAEKTRKGFCWQGPLLFLVGIGFIVAKVVL
jgi:hypothetical protein